MDDRVFRLLNWANNKLQTPYSIEFHPTNLCNLDCVMCGTRAEHRRLKSINSKFDPHRDAKFELSTKEALELVRQTAKLNVKRWLITGGGEPFLVKERTLKIMEEIKKFDMYGNLNTNGVLLNGEDIKRIIKMRWDMLMFSIDSHDAKTHDEIRGVKGTFEKAKKNLYRIKENKKSKKEPKIVFNSLLSNKNHIKIKELLNFAYDVGCEDITFIPLISFDTKSKSLAMSRPQESKFQNNIQEYIKYSKKLRVNTNLESLAQNKHIDTSKMDELIFSKICSQNKCEKKDFSQTPCFEPFLNVVIKMDGLVSPCCMLNNYKDNIRKNSLEEIWFGNYFSKLRKELKSGKLSAGCKNCVFSQVTHNSELREELKKQL